MATLTMAVLAMAAILTRFTSYTHSAAGCHRLAHDRPVRLRAGTPNPNPNQLTLALALTPTLTPTLTLAVTLTPTPNLTLTLTPTPTPTAGRAVGGGACRLSGRPARSAR
eukprot:scaffold60319_cov46-Phaeocystis_antarctica.AAC.1